METKTNKKLGILLLMWLLTPLILFCSLNLAIVNAEDPKPTTGALPLAPAKNSGNLSDAKGATFEEKFRTLYEILYMDLIYVIGGITVGFIVYSAFRLVTAEGEEEVINKQKKNLTWSIIGLVMISMAPKIEKIFFLGGTDDENNCSFICNKEHILASAGVFNEAVFIIVAFIKYIIGFVSILYIVIASANLVVFGFNDETMTKAKKYIPIALLSLIGINLASTFINKVFLSIEEDYTTTEATVNLGAGVAEIIGITNWVITWVGPLAILSLIIGALYYVVSLGDDEKMGTAKKIIINSIIGILIIYSAFGIVATFVSGSIEKVPENSFINLFKLIS